MNSQEHLIRIILLSLLLYAATSLLSSGHELKKAQSLEASLREELEAAQDERLLLQQRLEDGIDREELAQLARQRLGLVLPGEKIFYFTDTDREG